MSRCNGAAFKQNEYKLWVNNATHHCNLRASACSTAKQKKWKVAVPSPVLQMRYLRRLFLWSTAKHPPGTSRALNKCRQVMLESTLPKNPQRIKRYQLPQNSYLLWVRGVNIFDLHCSLFNSGVSIALAQGMVLSTISRADWTIGFRSYSLIATAPSRQTPSSSSQK